MLAGLIQELLEGSYISEEESPPPPLTSTCPPGKKRRAVSIAVALHRRGIRRQAGLGIIYFSGVGIRKIAIRIVNNAAGDEHSSVVEQGRGMTPARRVQRVVSGPSLRPGPGDT